MQSSDDLEREFGAYTRASELGIAPRIYASSISLRSIVVNYESMPTISWDQAHQITTNPRIAAGIRAIHSIPENPYN